MGRGWCAAVSIVARRRGILNTVQTGDWDPSRLGAALEMWWDSGDPTSYVISNGRVTELSDKSPNSRLFVQPTTNRRPTLVEDSLNQLNGISFNGFSHSMFTNVNFPLTGNPEFGAYAVYRKRSLTQGTVYGWGRVTAALGSMILFDNNNLVAYAYAGNNNYLIDPVPALTDVIQGLLKDAGAINTTSRTTRDGSPNARTGHSQDTPNIQNGPMWVGGFENDPNFFLNGVVYEIIVTGVRVSDTVGRIIEGYLAHRWGLQASLPPTHPYRFSPP